MNLGACTELSRYLAVVSVKPNSSKSNGSSAISHGFRCPTGCYSGIVSMSTSKRGKNTLVAGAGDEGLTYKGAGVDIDAGSELVRRIAKLTPGIGGFGGFFPHGDEYIISGMDGVGTKLMLSLETGIFETIGIDLVAMSVNDIVTSGAKPWFFLGYYATGHLDVDVSEKVIKGIFDGCKQSDCVLQGGERKEAMMKKKLTLMPEMKGESSKRTESGGSSMNNMRFVIDNIIQTKLLKHQEEALEWLLQRENSVESPAFWTRSEALRGGILNDAPTVGKKLTLLSLVACDKKDSVKTGTTLVVCVNSTTEHWLTQVRLHTVKGKMKVLDTYADDFSFDDDFPDNFQF
ncbi:hypothetical protein OROGR_007547 [Orobanche gracilis]